MSLNLAPNDAKHANQAYLLALEEAEALAASDAAAEQASRIASDARASDVRASTDVLVQLRANLSQLEELHARLQFSMAEVSYLIRK